MPIKSKQQLLGPTLVGTAAFLWATDALVRYPAIGKIDPTVIVFVEHFLAIFILFPWIFIKHKKGIFSLNIREWLAAAFCGIGGSALAQLYFTASFLYLNPSVAILIQKFQPVLVVCIAYVFLGERPAKKFYFWGLIALVAAGILSFPDMKFGSILTGTGIHSKGVQYAFGAALVWAASTVIGKILLKRTPPSVAIFWRFFFGFLATAVVLIFSQAQIPINWHDLSSPSALFYLFYLSLIPGLFAMIVYYSGLAWTAASVTTFIELLYPIAAIILNTIFLNTALEPLQIKAGLVLLIAVAMISF